jgi:hypothetical protein
MRKTATAIMALGALTLSAPSWSGTLYVPVVDSVNGNGTGLATQLWITNTAAVPRQARVTFLPENTDGNVRTTNPGVNLSAPAKGNLRIGDPGANGRIGMLEVDFVDTSVLQAVRLSRNILDVNEGRTIVPVVSSNNLVPASRVADLVGIMHVDNSIRTDIGIMNLGQTSSKCEVMLFRPDGAQLGGTASITLLPLSMRHFPNILSDQPNLTDARASVTCSTDFYTYATLHGADNQVDYFVTPALSGASTLARPGTTTPPAGCTTGAVCFDFPGTVHISTRSNPDRSITLSPPTAAYSKLRARLEVQVNGWAPPSSSAHGLLYMVRNNNKDMYANLFLKGPSSNQMVLRHGFNQTAGEKPKISKGFAPVVGQTYVVDYLFDPVAKTIVATMSLNGQEVVRITDRPNVNRVHIEPGQKILIGLSNPGHDSAEPASLGWVYKNLHVELIP